MILKYVEASSRGDDQVTQGGTGSPPCEFLCVDDATRALLLAAERPDSSGPVNIGTGSETSLRALADQIERVGANVAPAP